MASITPTLPLSKDEILDLIGDKTGGRARKKFKRLYGRE